MNKNNNVWVIKLRPSGGAQFGKLNKINNKVKNTGWKYFDKNELEAIRDDPAKYCMQEEMIAIGWALNPKNLGKRHISWKRYEKLYKDDYRTKKVNLSPCNLKKIRRDDICWAKDKDGNYFICMVKGNWAYKNDRDHWARDLVQVRKTTKWKEIGNASQIPAIIDNKLSTRGPTVINVTRNKDVEEDENEKYNPTDVKEISQFLYKQKNPKETIKTYSKEFNNHKKSKQTIDNIFTNNHLTWYDYEDLVGFYLQNKGYFIMPSTRTKSREDIEFVMKNKYGKTGVAQVKTGNQNLDAETYKNAVFDEIYLFCEKGVSNMANLNKKSRNKIIEISKDDLKKFMYEHLKIMPDRIKFMFYWNSKRKN